MKKPEWKDAPEWAHHLARDDDGEWWWFEFRPVWNEEGGFWAWGRRGRSALAVPSGIGNGTLEERPDGQ